MEEQMNFWDDFVAPLLGALLTLAVVAAFILGFISFFDALDKNYISHQELYDRYGLLGEHKMVVLDPSGNELSGQISGGGSFFFVMGGGSFEGQIQTGDVIQFEWVVPNGKSQVVEIPYRNILWDFSDEYTNPTFEFNFTNEHLQSSVYKDTEIINYNEIFADASAITIHVTRERYITEIQSKLSK